MGEISGVGFSSNPDIARAVLAAGETQKAWTPPPGGFVNMEGIGHPLDTEAGWDWLVMTRLGGLTPVAMRVTRFGGDWTIRLDHQLDTLMSHAGGTQPVLWVQANRDTRRAGAAWAHDIAAGLNFERVRVNATTTHHDGPQTARDFTWVKWSEVPSKVIDWG